MGTRDERVDAYIEQAADFARPILKEVRRRVHAACPEAVEDMKWSSPHFTCRGKLFCGIPAFKQHCAFGFWHPLMRDGDASLEGMGRFRIAQAVEWMAEGKPRHWKYQDG